MTDILLHAGDNVFSYRVGGIIIHNNCVLLHNTIQDEGHAFPGGHVIFGESTRDTLKRELKEELGINVTVGELKWVGEIFFPLGGKPCHQICLYYAAFINDTDSIAIPLSGSFKGSEFFEGVSFDVVFHWIPIDEIDKILLYPSDAKDFIKDLNGGVKHFIYRE